MFALGNIILILHFFKVCSSD